MEESCAVTAVSQWLNEETHRQFHLEKSVETIHNFFDPGKFSSISKKPAALAQPGEKVIMHISNFRPVKRVTDVVRAFKRITEQVDARLIMIGEGPERMSAVSVGRQLGLTDKITYLGVCGNIEEILPSADLVFQPSEHESFGLVPLEAMACGVPVIGTASGGIVEVVEHGECGYLCEVGDIESMAKYAIEILSDPEKAAHMGRQGQQRAHALFHRDRIIAQYEALYKNVREQHQKNR
jgi:N-acetyl-alpha-D-glucosaminyl L-malate synthase BshA